MKLYEILTENKKQVSEAPMSGLSALGNKAMAKFGSGKAQGKLDTGKIANQLHQEFQIYLGKTGREATKDAVVNFLSTKGYPTQGAATVINAALKAAGTAAPAGPLSNLKQTAGSLKTAAAKGVSNVINKVTDKLRPADTSAEPEKIEPTGEPAKPSFNNQLAGGNANYSMSTGFDMDTMKNTSVPLKKKKVMASSKINNGKPLSEAPIPGVLPQAVIDKAFLKAAQEAEIVRGKQTTGTAKPSSTPTQPASTDTSTDAPSTEPTTGGFGAGFKKGLAGKAPAKVDINQLVQRISAIEKKVGLA